MPAFQVKLLGHEQVAHGTMAFHFEKPGGFDFVAGQAVSVELTDPPAGDGQERRTFSLVSAPFESELVVATRMREGSAFKRALQTLPEGAGVKLEGPSGELTLDSAGRPAVLIAGGIGITPFVSILRQATRDESSRRLSLIYSNRRPEDAAFLEELQDLERRNENFRFLATMTDMTQSARKWDGETRLVDAEMVRAFVGGLAAPIYYVVGPPAMVEAMQAVLGRVGVPEGDIRTEEFYGY